VLHVGTTGNLTVQNIFIEDGCTDGDDLVDDGGGIFNRGTLTITNSTLDGNRAESFGGAIVNFGTIAALTDSTLSNNTADYSGEIYNGGGSYPNGTITLISNSTFSGNTGLNTFNGIGAIANSSIITTIENSTFSGNTSGNFQYAAGIDNSGTVGILRNTIVTNSITGPDCYMIGTSNDNLSDDGTCGDDTPLDAAKFNTTLADNGCMSPGANGCAMTHALDAGSDAIDTAGAGATATDQRGFGTFNGRDIGAWEFADSDEDGLGEADEVAAGTNPSNPDTDGDGLNDGEEIAATTDPLQPDTDADGIKDGLDPGPALIDSSDDNFVQCEDVSDASPSTIMKNTTISDLVLCADPDGIIVGEADPASPVQVTGTGELITITPGSTEYKGPFKVSTGGKVSDFKEAIPAPPLCGDGLVDPGEQCDDGNLGDGDGCSSACIIEFCGDGVVQGGLGEECDDGNMEDCDGCDGGCFIEFLPDLVGECV